MASLFFYREVKAFLYVLSFLPFLSYKQFTGLNLDGVSGISPLKKKTKFSKKRKIRSTVIYLWKRLKDSQTFLFFLITETKVLFLQNNRKIKKFHKRDHLEKNPWKIISIVEVLWSRGMNVPSHNVIAMFAVQKNCFAGSFDVCGQQKGRKKEKNRRGFKDFLIFYLKYF